MKKDLIAPIAIIAFVVLGGLYMLYAPKAPEIDFRPIDVGGGSITVGDQYDATQVTLDATLVAPGFITVHRSMGPAPADIIGQTELLQVGDYTDLVIDLEGEMLPGYRYITILVADDGDGVYESGVDLPVMVDGTVVRPDFLYSPEDEVIPVPGTDEVIEIN